MIITKAIIKNFGKLYEKTIYFSPGLNVVYGENESGKSTLQRFLTGMLFGMEKQRGRASRNDIYQKYQPWEAPAWYAGALELLIGNKSFVLERNFYHKEKSVRLYNQEDGEELSVEHGDLEMLLGGIGKRTYENTYCISQAAIEPQKDFPEELKNYLVNAVHGGEAGIDLSAAGKRLQQKKKEAEEKKRRLEGVRQECRERLKWEQEIIEEDIMNLRKKLSLEPPPALGDNYKEKNGVMGRAGLLCSFMTKEAVCRFLLLVSIILLHFFWNRIFSFEGAVWRFIEAVLCFSWFLWTGLWFWKKRVDKDEEPEPDPWKVLQEQLEEKETRLHNIVEEAAELSGMTSEEREVCEDMEGIILAMETLEKAAREIYEDGRAKLHDSVSGIFSSLTGRKYNRVELSEQMKLVLYDGEGAIEQRLIEPWNLSRGTMEQLYFSLRLGAGRLMMKEETMPLLLDEPFCTYDEIRLARTLQWLSAWEGQVVLATCQKREMDMLDRMELKYHKILF